MRLRDLLPRAGWLALAFTGFGAGAAVALVSQAPEPAPSAQSIVAAGPHCRIAATMPMQGQMAQAVKTYEEADPELRNDLGTLSYPVSTSSPDAQAYFDQGIREAANFNHAEARRAFGKAQGLDPNCAMCFIAEALVLGPNINAPMDPAANQPAVEAVRKAQSLAAGATEKERGLIEALRQVS